MKRYQEHDQRSIEKLIGYMQEHCTEPFDIQKHASMIFFSESKLNKVFKVYAGVGPGTYFRRLRIQKALDLYRQGMRNWTEVSHTVGYSDLPSFSKAFKKITGYSPSTYSAA